MIHNFLVQYQNVPLTIQHLNVLTFSFKTQYIDVFDIAATIDTRNQIAMDVDSYDVYKDSLFKILTFVQRKSVEIIVFHG